MNDEKLKLTSTLNNIRKNDFDIGDYKLCKSEAELVMVLLRRRINEIEFDEELKVIG